MRAIYTGPADTFYVQLANDGRFEKVNEEVFSNRLYAITEDGAPRYNHNFFVVNREGALSMMIEKGKPEVLAIIMRILAVPPNQGSSPGGFFLEPKHVHFARQRSMYLYELSTGNKYRLAPRKAEVDKAPQQ